MNRRDVDKLQQAIESRVKAEVNWALLPLSSEMDKQVTYFDSVLRARRKLARLIDDLWMKAKP